jgi:hypothetical protein
MNYGDVFPSIMKKGGFDAIVGNPPYVRQEMIGEQKAYFDQHFKVADPIADLYTYFVERGISLLRTYGRFGFIVANKWMRANYGEKLRKWLKTKRIYEIIDFDGLQIFKGATTYPCILLASNDSPTNSFYMTEIRSLDFESLDLYAQKNRFQVAVEDLADKCWQLVRVDKSALLQKLNSVGVPLENYAKCKIYRGVLTGLNDAFVIDANLKRTLLSGEPQSKDLLKPFLLGRSVFRYADLQPKHFLICIPSGWTRSQIGSLKDPWTWFLGRPEFLWTKLKRR